MAMLAITRWYDFSHFFAVSSCKNHAHSFPNQVQLQNAIYPLVFCYIAVENCPFIVDLPIKYGDFP